MASSTKKRAQGGGRTANSEPRQQVFKEFNGCNFELSPHEFTLGDEVNEQTDLQMNYVVVQNNAEITSNKTIQTRNNIEKLFDAPNGKEFTGVCMLVENEFYACFDDESLQWGILGNPRVEYPISLVNKSGSAHHYWKSLAFADNKIIALSETGNLNESEMWTGDIGLRSVENAKQVGNPLQIEFTQLIPHGTLQIVSASSAYDQDAYPYRISISCAYINKYGPTKHSVPVWFAANETLENWHGGRYLEIVGTAPVNDGAIAVEFYYSVGNASTLLFAGRCDSIANNGHYSFNWYGYIDATNMWPVGNLVAPTENTTRGVSATHIASIDSRLYFWGDKKYPYRLWIGGNPGNLFSVASGTGGGFVDVEPGSKQEIRVVTKYKTQSGNSIVTMLCDSPNSSVEQRFNLVENSVSLSNEQSMKSWQAEQVAGAVGCKSYRGALVCEDGLYAVNRYGLALTTMTMEYNSQIRANYVSDPIKPVFVDKLGFRLKNAILLERDGILYIAFGDPYEAVIDNILFCYDIDAKAWWTIDLQSIDENIDNILNLIHIDYEGYREGIGIVTPKAVYLLPLTQDDSHNTNANFKTTIQTGELATQQPRQNWFYLSQMEFNFDYFRGSVLIQLDGIDQFGRHVTVKKTVDHSTTQYNLTEYMRVDLRLISYQLRIEGYAKFRMTHFISKLYTMSAKQGLVWGFNDSKSFRAEGDIYPTFKDYNDIKRAIIV